MTDRRPIIGYFLPMMTLTRQLSVSLLAPAVALALSGCGSDVTFTCPDGAPLCSIVEVTGQPKKTAGGLRIDRIELNQAVENPLSEDGETPVEQSVGIVAGRDTLVRVFVSPLDDYEVRDVGARMLLYRGDEVVAAAEGIGRPSGASTQSDLGSTINIRFDRGLIPAGELDWTVELVEATVDSPRVGRVSPNAVFPPAGVQNIPLEVTDVGTTTRLYIIPLEIDGNVPPTDPAVVEQIRSEMLSTYPIPDIEVEVGPPHTYNGSAGNLQPILQEVTGIRTDEPERGIEDDQYVFGLVPGGGGGLSWVGGSALDSGARNSVGGQWTIPHEVGHAHGRLHGPCGGAANPHPDYPYEGSSIGVWGWDLRSDTLLDPEQVVDLMSYCGPTWTSDFYWEQNFEKTLGIYEAYNAPGAELRAVGRTYRELWVYPSGDVTWGRTSTWREPHGTSRTVELLDADGQSLGTVDAIWSPLNHTVGGVLLVPDEEDFASVRLIDTAHIPVRGPVIQPIELAELVE